MAKKKSRKNKKATKNQPAQSALNFADSSIGKATTATIATLVGEIMVVAIERVIQKLSKHQPSNTEPEDDGNLITQAILELQDHLLTFQKPVQNTLTDVAETAKSVAQDVSTDPGQSVNAVKNNLSGAIAQPVDPVKTTANTAVSEMLETAKTVAGAVRTLSSAKRKKKKGKKNGVTPSI